jgi:hypothetical protein
MIETRDQFRDRQRMAVETAAWQKALPSRQQRRESARRALAECQSAESEFLALRTALAGIQAEMDNAANEHVQSCEPIQAELARLSDTTTNRIVAGLPGADARDDRRRSELLAELGTLNTALENRLRDLQVAAVPIEKRKTVAGARLAERPKFIAELHQTASPEATAYSRVCDRTLEIARNRLRSAQEKARQWPNDAFRQLELSTSEQLLVEAEQASTAALNTLLTE